MQQTVTKRERDTGTKPLLSCKLFRRKASYLCACHPHYWGHRGRSHRSHHRRHRSHPGHRLHRLSLSVTMKMITRSVSSLYVQLQLAVRARVHGPWHIHGLASYLHHAESCCQFVPVPTSCHLEWACTCRGTWWCDSLTLQSVAGAPFVCGCWCNSKSKTLKCTETREQGYGTESSGSALGDVRAQACA